MKRFLSKKHGVLLCKLLVSAGLLGWFLSKVGWQQTWQQVTQVSWWLWPVGVGLYLLAQWISAWRWRLLAQILDISAGCSLFFQLYLLGMFFSLFLPGSIGGDVARMWYLHHYSHCSKTDSALSILAERGLGLLTVVLLTALWCSMAPMRHLLPLWAHAALWLGVLLGAAGWLILSLPRIQAKAQAKASTGLEYSQKTAIFFKAIPFFSRPKLLWNSLLLSIGVQCLMSLLHWLMTVAMHVSVPLWPLLAIYGLVGLVSIAPISFNGIGVREGLYVYFLGQLGVPPQKALAFGVVWFFLNAITSLLGGGFAWLKLAAKKQAVKD